MTDVSCNLTAINLTNDGVEPIPYVDREISWLKFNERVMALASDVNIPLLERVKFLSIANSNLDEFFTIRVAARLKEGSVNIDNVDMQSDVNMSGILKKGKTMLGEIDTLYDSLKRELQFNHIHINGPVLNLYTGDLDTELERDSATESKKEKYFFKHIFPSLTPLIIDTTRPLPHLKPFSIYIALILKTTQDENEKIGLIEIPPHLNRLVNFTEYAGEFINIKHWFFIEDIIIDNLHNLYPGIEYYDITAFRILRDGDSSVDNNIAFHETNYVESMISHVRSRILYNETIRVDIWGNPRKKILNMLKDSLDISKKFLFHSMTRLKMSDIMQIYSETKRPELKYPGIDAIKPFKNYKGNKSMLNAINRQDILVHHPYESFNDTVLRFVAEACVDPHVVSIKQTLYRSGNESKIMEYLLHAAQNGKNVVVVMELKARFDEETNIEWAEKLKRAGAIVVYGYEHIKTHAKMMHVFRIKDGEPQQFVHIGTGNYSEKNAKIYTDFSYFTANRKICQDVSTIFNMLTGGFISESIQLNHIKISPIMTRQFLYEMIDEQIAKGDEGYILIKVNNISDPGLTAKLYEASNAGVRVDIISRGSCSIIPGVEGFSENILVFSIVGRFLEHSRILKFGDGDGRLFITSSDMMTRNLDRRLELMFEVSDNAKAEIANYLNLALNDNVNAFEMNSDGEYTRVKRSVDDPIVDSQIGTYEYLKDRN
jgi:polyphosphate kinase